MFAIASCRYIEVLFHTFWSYWGTENRLLHEGLRYIQVRYIEALLYLHVKMCFIEVYV